MGSGLVVLDVSPFTALLGSFGLSFSFVGSLYLWKLAGYKDANRDDTGTIQRRFLSALLSCIFSVVLISSLTDSAKEGDNGLTFFELFGFESENVFLACFNCLVLTMILFVGPLAQHMVGVYEGSVEFFDLGDPWVALRNYVLAPFTEEFVFRACLVRLWVAASFPMWTIIALSPFCFAMAHAHHFIEHMRKTGNKKTALTQVLFQVFYTSLFGMYSNFLLLRTGSTVAVILTHTFCNHQGFPNVGFLFDRYNPLHPHRLWLGGLYLTGVVAFCCSIRPLSAGFVSTFSA